MTDPRRHRPRRSIAGFSLLEMTIVTMIVGLVAATGVVVGRNVLNSAMQASTNNRLNAIETALMAYRMANNRLPCPADATLTEASTSYGVEAANAGTCTGGAPSANFHVAVGNGTVVEGGVPVRALNLTDEFMYDGWGRKFGYAVWAGLTSPLSFQSYGVVLNCGLATVKNASGGVRSNVADYVLVSYGINGHGGYNASGQRQNAGSVNANELVNCHCNSSGADTGYLATYVQQDWTEDPANPLDNFDDIVRYKERWQMQNFADQYYPGGAALCPQIPAGFRIDGINASDHSGWSIATGDINGDGIPDLIIGAPAVAGSTGAVYVVFGTSAGFPDPLPLSSLNGTNGFVINGVSASDQSGISVAAGDFNGDGFADIMIGAYKASPSAHANAGSVFVLYGHSGTWPASFNLSTLNGTNGFRIDSVTAGEQVGYTLAAGLVTGTGYSSVIIGAPFANGNKGEVYAVFGPPKAALAEYTLDNNGVTGVINGTNGTQIQGVSANDKTGSAVLTGDINGDGIADIIIGSAGVNASTGNVSVVFGKGTGWGASSKLNGLNGTNGFRVNGVNGGEGSGTSIGVGDINGDNIQDLIVGAPQASPGGNAAAGSTYVLFGHTAKFQPNTNLSNLNGTSGFRVDGIAAGDNSGTSVAAGDINGDGIQDLIIGAYHASPGARAQAGETYVVFGAASGWASSMSLSTLNGGNGFELDGATAGDNVGWAVGALDINGDSKQDVVTSAYPASHGGPLGSGSTYVYFGKKQSTAWTNPYNLNGL